MYLNFKEPNLIQMEYINYMKEIFIHYGYRITYYLNDNTNKGMNYYNEYVGKHIYFILYNLICLIIILLMTSLFVSYAVTKKGISKRLPDRKRVLLVTAHPDDECMFFGPAILHLVKHQKLYLICLSSGNYYGQGTIRKGELFESCKILGINTNNIHLYSHDLLLDDPIEEWSSELVADIILNTVQTLTIDVIISFDGIGVSGHKNHISIYKGLELLKRKNMLPENCQCFVLDSVTLLRKFLGVINILYDFPFSYMVFSCSYDEQQIVKLAMAKHVSQYVWFRRLFMFFSRYTYINSFTRTR